MSERTSTSTSTSTRFRPAPVGSVLDGTADHGAERARAAGWSAGWAAGARAAGAAAMGQRRALDDAQVASERAALCPGRGSTGCAATGRPRPFLGAHRSGARGRPPGRWTTARLTLARPLLGCGLATRTMARARRAHAPL